MSQQAADLQIGGITCASCAARIEKKLNWTPGVEASVTFATEKACVLLGFRAVSLPSATTPVTAGRSTAAEVLLKPVSGRLLGHLKTRISLRPPRHERRPQRIL